MSARDDMPPIHVPFAWLNDKIKDDQNAQFAEMAMIVARGAHTIANILRNNTSILAAIADGDVAQALLPASDIDALTELMILSLRNLDVAAEERLDRLEFATREGAKP